MNFFELAATIFGWVILLLMIIGAITLVLAIFLGVWRGILSWFPHKSKASLSAYLSDATLVAMHLYRDDNEDLRDEKVSTFRAGARWGWDATNRK